MSCSGVADESFSDGALSGESGDSLTVGLLTLAYLQRTLKHGNMPNHCVCTRCLWAVLHINNINKDSLRIDLL